MTPWLDQLKFHFEAPHWRVAVDPGTLPSVPKEVTFRFAWDVLT